MRLPAVVVVCIGIALAADSTRHVDPETGLTFASFTNDRGIAFRVAIDGGAASAADAVSSPSRPPSASAILQITAPRSIGWAGMAWGGSMLQGPLTMVWANGPDGVMLSSRKARLYKAVPEVYEGAVYRIFSTGTFVNSTHFQLTAQCWGCLVPANTAADSDALSLSNNDGDALSTLAFACSTTPVTDPASNASTFRMHSRTGHWTHDFAAGANTDFAAAVARLSAELPVRKRETSQTKTREEDLDPVHKTGSRKWLLLRGRPLIPF